MCVVSGVVRGFLIPSVNVVCVVLYTMWGGRRSHCLYGFSPTYSFYI